MEKKFMLENLIESIIKGSKLSDADSKTLRDAIDNEIRHKPFRVAIIGQSGVGKTSTLNAVFGLKGYVADIAEGTTQIEEKIFPMGDGFNLAIYDMPGLNNDIEKDLEYEQLYKKILPTCDVIVYIINAHSKDIGEDCRILKEVVLPICQSGDTLKNIILAVNKIDTIGESMDPNDPELRWDIINNVPTQKLKECIRVKLGAISDRLIAENLVGGDDAIDVDKIVFYSAVFNYNLGEFLMAITRTPRGVFWAGTVGPERLGKWSDMLLNK